MVTEWGEWDPCSVTCGLGMRRRERMVKMPPIDGSMCKTEVAEVEKCMMPECRKLFCLRRHVKKCESTHFRPSYSTATNIEQYFISFRLKTMAMLTDLSDNLC